jgi:prepilin peptidase CpaA
MLHSIVLFAAATALLFAAAHDVAVRTVPNRASLVVALAGMGSNALQGQLMPTLFSGGVVFAGTWYCWRRGWIGGGDVKLLTAGALLVPPASVPELILSTAIAGGLLALFYICLARLMFAASTWGGSGVLSAAAMSVPALRLSAAATPGPTAWLPALAPRSSGPRSLGLLPRVWRAERRRIRRGLSLPYACAIAAGVLLTLCSPVSFG